MKKILLSIFYFLISAGTVFAQGPLGFIWRGTSCTPDQAKGPTGVCTLCDAIIVAQNIINFLFELAIPIAVAMIVWGAFVFMTAGGSEDRVASGKKIMTSAVIGLVIALGAWVIVNIVLHALTGTVNFPWNEVRC